MATDPVRRSLVDYGFLPAQRLTINRPLRFEEFERHMKNAIFVSATPGDFGAGNGSTQVVEQIIRPTGLPDPLVEIRLHRWPGQGCHGRDPQGGSRRREDSGHHADQAPGRRRTDFLAQNDIRARYLHSDIDTLERTEIIRLAAGLPMYWWESTFARGAGHPLRWDS